MIASPSESSRRRFAVALVVAGSIIAAVPVAGELRSRLLTTLGPRFPLAVTLAIVAALGVTIASAARRVPRLTGRRLLIVAAAAIAAAGYVAWAGSTDASIRAVELFHFIEYGLITFAFYRVWRDRADVASFVVAGLAAFTAGVVEEAYQWFLPARVGELRDVWLNGVSVTCALAATGGVWAPVSLRMRSAHDAALIGRALAVTVVALAAFVHLVHLGQRIADGPTAFDSRFSREGLDATARDRAAAWRSAPPVVRPPRLSREDQYMTEGLQHVQARNAAWAAGDAVLAWHENVILERHFAPVLDTPSYVARTGHRWSEDQRHDAERQAGADTGTAFVSAAFPYPLFRWSPIVLWSLALSLAAGLWWGGRWLAVATP